MTHDSWLTETTVVMKCRIGRLPFVYLGLPIGGDSRRRMNFWDPCITIYHGCRLESNTVK